MSLNRVIAVAVCVAVMALSSFARAEAPGVFVVEVKAPLDEVYKRVNKSLDGAGYWVAYELDMFKGMSGSLGRKLGEDFNRAKLEGIRTMVFCNGEQANQVMNADPDMLALCPMHLTLIHKAGATKVLFARPSIAGKGSAAEPALKQIEDAVIGVIRAGTAQ
jgi:uncharacterized protein (DUF302 family)